LFLLSNHFIGFYSFFHSIDIHIFFKFHIRFNFHVHSQSYNKIARMPAFRFIPVFAKFNANVRIFREILKKHSRHLYHCIVPFVLKTLLENILEQNLLSIRANTIEILQFLTIKNLFKQSLFLSQFFSI